MAFDRQYEPIVGIFCNNHGWKMDAAKLTNLTTKDFTKEISEAFEGHKKFNRFSAQVVREFGVNVLADPFEIIIVSLGDSLCSYHYCYNTYSKEWILKSIGQEFFENIVKPFQIELNWKVGDGFFKRVLRQG